MSRIINLEDFRQEVRDWLEVNCPASQRTPGTVKEIVYGGRNYQFPSEDSRIWLERMANQGWTVPEWPREFGGAGLTREESKVLGSELRRLNCRTPLSGHGIWMLGPALLKFGTERQKREHLPKIAHGEVRWCQGYSEPNAGSDLAGLNCSCEDEGDYFIVNGQKCWITNADKSDWIFVLVRTDPANPKLQDGISFLLIDMASPGVSVRPVELINGNKEFCDTFFDNVKVPKGNLIGGLNNGWLVAKELLVYEREMMSRMQDYMLKLPYTLIEYAKRYLPAEENGRIASPVLRDRLARHLMNAQIMSFSHQRAYEEDLEGLLDKRSTSYFKAYATEEDKRGDEILMAILGSQGLGWDGVGFADAELRATRQFLMNKGLSIGGGTTEIQLNLIAKHALGLPSS